MRSGGHSWAAWSIRDDALLIDLGGLRDIRSTRRPGSPRSARPSGGHRAGPVPGRPGPRIPGGHCESVGLGGYLLQGGRAGTAGSWGWACENVVGIDAVTADGRQVHADATENADLYRAARGAGPGFPALVARFYLRTHPQPPDMMQDTWTFPVQAAGPLLAWLHEILPGLDRTVEPVVAATRLPDVPLGAGVVRPPGPLLLLHTTAMGDDAGAGGEAAGGVRRGARWRAGAGPRARADVDRAEKAAQSAQNPPGYRYLVDCTWRDAPGGGVGAAAGADLGRAAHRALILDLVRLGPRGALPDMAFSVEAQVYLATYADLHR